MPTLLEIHNASGISMRKLRYLEKRKWLVCDANEHPTVTNALRMLRSGNRLSVQLLLDLMAQPALIDQLGPTLAAHAREQIAALDNPEPAAIAWGDLSAAQFNDEAALANLVRWAQGIIPSDRCVSHAWLAVRLALAVPPESRKHEVPRLQRLMLILRKQPDFADWHSIEHKGSRKVTVYHRPWRELDI